MRINSSGVTAKVQALLQEAGIESMLYHGHEPDPTFGMARRCMVKMMEYQPDVIVAIGGGSSMDATKAAWTFYEHPELSDSDAAIPFGLPTLRHKAKFIAVTTTSGTGSEVTSFAVVANDTTGIKYPMADYNLTPDLAILGIVHSMAHKTGRVFGIPHGCANAIYLTYVIQYNAAEAAPLFADIAKRLGLSGSSDEELTNALITLIADLRAQLHIPASYKSSIFSNEE